MDLPFPWRFDASRQVLTVAPYWYTYKTRVKTRWFGLFLQAFTDEFECYRTEGIATAIDAVRKGRLTVAHNDDEFDSTPQISLPTHSDARKFEDVIMDEAQAVNLLTKCRLANGNVIYHTIHKHEQPIVWRGGIKILHFDERANIVAVEKPAGVPVHPCGRNYFNSLTTILSQAFSMENVETGGLIDFAQVDDRAKLQLLANVGSRCQFHPLFRLDSCTSGVLLFRLEAGCCNDEPRSTTEIVARKQYVALVDGDFSQFWAAQTLSDDGYFDCGESLVQIKPGVFWTSKGASECELLHDSTQTLRQERWGSSTGGFKEACTRLKFQRKMVSADGGCTSEVVCVPITGRTHQIRVHLASCGFPIIGDGKYYAWHRYFNNSNRSDAPETETDFEGHQCSDPSNSECADCGKELQQISSCCLHALQYVYSRPSGPEVAIRCEPPWN